MQSRTRCWCAASATASGRCRALDDVSLAVPRGAFVVLLGPNGAGKSTLFALVTRLYDNVSGEIRILGHDVRRQPTAALAAAGRRVPEPQPRYRSERAAEPHLSRRAARHRPAPRATAGRSRRSARSGSPNAPATRCARCRAARRGASRSRARCCTIRPACCSTRRRSVSTSPRARACSPSCAGWSRSGASGVLWATHLVDEVAADDHVVLLHKGRVRFAGAGAGPARDLAQAGNLRGAFMRVTEDARARRPA